MQINDIFPADSQKKELGYDLKDDLICFMQNDPAFYRKTYFPVMHKFKEYIKSDLSVRPKAFESIVKKAYSQYKDTFKVEGLESELSEELCREVCEELHRIERQNINDGHYDDE
jgi:hypothetical protein